MPHSEMLSLELQVEKRLKREENRNYGTEPVELRDKASGGQQTGSGSLLLG